MEQKFYCTNPQCSGEDNKPYVRVMNQEFIMDEKNMAQMFCPHCKGPLVKCEEKTPGQSC